MIIIGDIRGIEKSKYFGEIANHVNRVRYKSRLRFYEVKFNYKKKPPIFYVYSVINNCVFDIYNLYKRRSSVIYGQRIKRKWTDDGLPTTTGQERV